MTDTALEKIVLGTVTTEFTPVDVVRHAGNDTPTEPPPKPTLGGAYDLDDAVLDVLPIPGTKVTSVRKYGVSLWGQTAKIFTELPDGEKRSYFLKSVPFGDLGRVMIEGEFESLKAIHAVAPGFVPLPHGWGKYRGRQYTENTYFLLAQFREVGEQPPDPIEFTARLADMHKRSISPTGKFGFHTTTCHAKIPQITDCWEDSWEVFYGNCLAYAIRLDGKLHGEWPEFRRVCKLTLERVVPRLLGPLQAGGRNIKPCLVHGDIWDENTATDAETGEPFIFDAGSFYAHNEYDLGNWRAPRHRLSKSVYVENYKRNFPPSEPVDEWDDRNILYSLRFELVASALIPGSNLRQVVKNNMTLLCEKYCPEELRAVSGLGALSSSTESLVDEKIDEGGEEKREVE